MSINPQEYIDYITEKSKKVIGNSFTLVLRDNSHSLRCYVVEGTSSGVTRFNEPQSVSLLKWFDEFWLYLEIKFTAKEERHSNKKVIQTNIQISLSVFQGVADDNEKHQLFRAEWDDYNNLDEMHAQPHWHITSSQAIERVLRDYADTFEKQDFVDLLDSERKKVFDVEKIHFAMNGDWQNNKECVHRIGEKQQVTNWLLGLLTHLRTELTKR